MTDQSVPVGDRGPEPAVRPGLHMAREALAGAVPADFTEQVVRLARREEWSVIVPGAQSDPGHPHLVLLRRGLLVAAWIASAPIGFKGGDQWRARFGRASGQHTGTVTAVWNPKDGMGPVEAILGGDFDGCGIPSTDGTRP